jgi:hypothetical protein
MMAAQAKSKSAYADETEEKNTLELFRSMDKDKARAELAKLLRAGEKDKAFDLVWNNPFAAMCALQNKVFAATEGKGWNLGLHAVHSQETSRIYVMGIEGSEIANLKITGWGRSIFEQAKFNLKTELGYSY